MSERAIVFCPGRGSYTAAQLGSLHLLPHEPRFDELRAVLESVDERRVEAGDDAILEMDAADRFGSRFLRGENAAPLILAVTALEFQRLDLDKIRVVGVGGNSMGWYSALYCAGAWSIESVFEAVQTMGAMTRDGTIGGQVVYPVVDPSWRRDPQRVEVVQEALASAAERGHRVGHSVRFGGFAVLWGDEEGVAAMLGELPRATLGEQEYPLRLPGNSAFHSDLMAEASARARAELPDLPWTCPRQPLIDGRGAQWRPLTTEVDALRDYTFGHQVLETFDFTAAVRTALREYAPDRIIALGPGESLGGAIAHVLVQERWQGISGREAFLERQRDDPIVISLARPDQAQRVT